MKKNIIIAASILLGCLIVGLSLFFTFKKPTTKKDIREDTYVVFVKINPLVKLTFKAQYEVCKDESGTEYACVSYKSNVTDYTLINDDAKDIYKDIDFNGMDVWAAIGQLCATARKNDIAFKSFDITTNYNYMKDVNIVKEKIKETGKYDENFDVFVDVKEIKNDADIITELESNQKKYNVSFNRDNGEREIVVSVKENNKIEALSAGSKEGYTFVEWQLNGTKYDFDTPVTSDITLKAIWDKKTTEPVSKPVEETKPVVTPKPEPTPTYKSTADVLNLNDNILVVESYSVGGSSNHCGSSIHASYGAITNAKEVIDYAKKAYPQATIDSYTRSYYITFKTWDDETQTELIPRDTFLSYKNDILGRLKYNSAKTNAFANAIKALNGKPGISNATVRLSGNDIEYWEIDFLYFDYNNSSDIMPLLKTWDAKTPRPSEKDYDIVEFTVAGTGGCGGGYGEETVILNEALCAKYNLTCTR